MKDNRNSPIFITGIERSGSSIIARILSHNGVYSGSVTDMYENRAIKEIVDMFYSFTLGIHPSGQFPLPNRKYLSFNGHDVYESIDKYLTTESCDPDPKWFYKSSRLAQTWPMWNHIYPNAKWIIVRRRTGDIIQSCMKTGYMNAFDKEYNRNLIRVKTPQEGWLWWVHRHEEMFVEMIGAGLNCKIVWPERMATGDFQQMQETMEWLGLEWNDNIIDLVQPLFERSPQKHK